MAPTINDGEVVLHVPRALPAVGDIIFVSHPYMQNVKIMKRISEINGEGNMTLTGDNPADSTDSRTFGLIPIKSSLGRVICRLK